jgi:hypothetical protein
MEKAEVTIFVCVKINSIYRGKLIYNTLDLKIEISANSPWFHPVSGPPFTP